MKQKKDDAVLRKMFLEASSPRDMARKLISTCTSNKEERLASSLNRYVSQPAVLVTDDVVGTPAAAAGCLPLETPSGET
jgi:hypothetical protein